MAKSANPLRQIRLVYRRTPMVIKVVLLVAIVFSTVTLLTLRGQLLKAQAEIDSLKQQAQQEEQKKEDLSEKNEGLGSVDGIEDIAQGELGLVDPDTIIIQPES